MEIINDIRDFVKRPCAATVGSFDGVHLGHRAMIAELRKVADERGLPLVAVTFARHPRLLFDGSCEPFLLTQNGEKESLFSELGVDVLVKLDFDTCMASMCAERFMREVLVDTLGVKLLGVGYDHRFGKPCEGECLEQYVSFGNALGVEVIGLSPFTLDGNKVSSTVVRKALAAGDVAQANSLLGYNYRLTGCVVTGAGIGRGLGFPTANVQLGDEMKMLPLDGVYEVEILHGGERLKGVMNIGVKPTIGENMLRTIEVHIIDFSGDLYGQVITVELVRRLRGELQFANVQALKLQIGVDVERVKRGV